MPQRGYNFRMPSHPLLQIAYVLVGGIVLIGALFMGAVLLTVALGLGLIVGAAALLRAWWLGRSGPGPARSRPAQARPAAGKLLDAEYSVVAERDERDGRGP
jgi:small-conductance mechanosensitive channel